MGLADPQVEIPRSVEMATGCIIYGYPLVDSGEVSEQLRNLLDEEAEGFHHYGPLRNAPAAFGIVLESFNCDGYTLLTADFPPTESETDRARFESLKDSLPLHIQVDLDYFGPARRFILWSPT